MCKTMHLRNRHSHCIHWCPKCHIANIAANPQYVVMLNVCHTPAWPHRLEMVRAVVRAPLPLRQVAVNPSQHALALEQIASAFNRLRRCQNVLTRLVCDESRSIRNRFYRVCQKWLNLFFCQNSVKSSLNLRIFNRRLAKTIEISEVHSLSISLNNLCQRTTVLKADALNCCIMLSCCHRKSSNNLIKHTVN